LQVLQHPAAVVAGLDTDTLQLFASYSIIWVNHRA
jgi:hypothetical protein